MGTPRAPRSRYDFRLKTLVQRPNGYLVAGPALTGGIRKRVQYYDPFNLVTYDGDLWELDPVEVVRPRRPAGARRPALDASRAAGARRPRACGHRPAAVPARDTDLALIVSAQRDARATTNDRQQPFNLRVPGGAQTLGAGGRIYDVRLPAASSRATRSAGSRAASRSRSRGRRVLAQPLHEPGGRQRRRARRARRAASRSALDGSMAALVPARRAMSWQLADPARRARGERALLGQLPAGRDPHLHRAATARTSSTRPAARRRRTMPAGAAHPAAAPQGRRTPVSGVTVAERRTAGSALALSTLGGATWLPDRNRRALGETARAV